MKDGNIELEVKLLHKIQDAYESVEYKLRWMEVKPKLKITNIVVFVNPVKG